MPKQPKNQHEGDFARIRRKMIAAVAAGQLLPHEIGQAMAVTRMTVFRWLREAGIDHRECRRKYASPILDRMFRDSGVAALPSRHLKRAAGQKAVETFEAAGHTVKQLEPSMPKYTQHGQEQVVQNTYKHEVLIKLRAGTMTIPQAAKRAQVSVSAICGWCRLHGIELPDEFNQPRRKPRD